MASKSALANQSVWTPNANNSVGNAVLAESKSKFPTAPVSGESAPSVFPSGYPTPSASKSSKQLAMSGLSAATDHTFAPVCDCGPIPTPPPIGSGVSGIGLASGQMPDGSSVFVNLIAPSHIDEFSGVEGAMPRFIRRRSAPAGHAVFTDEVDAEMYDRSEKDILNMRDLSSWLKAEKMRRKMSLGRAWRNYLVLPCADLVSAALHSRRASTTWNAKQP